MSKWLLKIEGKEEDEYLTMSFFCQISRAVIIKTVVGISGASTVIAVIQHYIH